MSSKRPFGLLQYHIAQQQTVPYPVVRNRIAPKAHTTPINNNHHTPLPKINHTFIVPSLDHSSEDTHQLPALAIKPILPTKKPDFLATEPEEPLSESIPDEKPPKPELIREAQHRTTSRIIAVLLVILLALAIYFIWRPTSTSKPPTAIVTPAPSLEATSITEKQDDTEEAAIQMIQVYIVGAVKHPGVYTLPADARVQDLLKAAGGPLPDANLVALNLAAKLLDGQEIYVTLVGEKPPTSVGGVTVPGNAIDTNTTQGSLVNINTATVDEMRQQLHVSSKTAQSIVDYREQNGDFTAINQLRLVVSDDIYNKIKDQVMI